MTRKWGWPRRMRIICQRTFLIGDGAGVGKGRTIAGIISENYLKGGKRAVWVSVFNDLKYNSERELRDIGAGKIEDHPLNKFEYVKISSAVNGNVKKDVVFKCPTSGTTRASSSCCSLPHFYGFYYCCGKERRRRNGDSGDGHGAAGDVYSAPAVVPRRVLQDRGGPALGGL